MTKLSEARAALAKAQADLAACQTSSATKDQTIADQKTTNTEQTARIASLEGQVADLEAKVAELEAAAAANPKPTPTAIPKFGFWPESPDKVTFPAQRTDLNLDDVVMAYRERGGRGGLNDPLIKSDTLWPKTKIAVEVDPRWSGQEQAQYFGAAKAALETAKIAALAQQAAARKDEIAYVEIDSEANLDKHAPAGESVPSRAAGFAKFTIAVCEQFEKYAPSIPRVPSFTRGLFTGTLTGKPEDWLTPEVLAVIDGIGVDGYSSPYSTGKVNTPDFLFGDALTWAKAHDKPLLITEWGTEETRGDNGKAKGEMYDSMLAFMQKPGVVHIMLNTATDGPAPDNMNWIYHTTSTARQGFIRLTQGLK